MRYKTDISINFVITSLIIIGGLGYFVLLELYYRKKQKLFRISTHTKIVGIVTVFLILSCMFMLLSFEWNNPKTLGGLSLIDKITASYFTSVNYRTAGFNTIDLGGLTDANIFFGTIFMIIGGAPGSTAGGIKVTVFAIIVISTWHTLKGSSYPHVFNRSISQETVNQSVAILMVASFYVIISSVFISEWERLSFLKTLFEVCSAFGTVGVSTGNGGVLSYSALFSDFGKMNIILLMIIGRVGVLAFTIAIIGEAMESRIKYAEGKIII
jgi:trk system potassium uptake protein TrkH